MKPYALYRDEMIKRNSTRSFREAVAQVDEYISDPKKYKTNAEPGPCLEVKNAHFDDVSILV